MTTDIENQVHRLIRTFHPNAEINSISEIDGGCINRLWKAESNTGNFALKFLNPIYASRPDVRKNYVLSEKIARDFEAVGFPSVPALCRNNNPLIDIDNDTFMLFPWIDGQVISVSDASSDQCFLIGKMNATLHSANLTIDNLFKPELKLFTATDWQNIINRGEDQNQFWTKDLKSIMPLLVSIYEKCELEKSRLLDDQVITHGDINFKNIIWQDDKSFKLIDWEAAGYANPLIELLETAFELSGQWEGVLSQEKFEAVIRGYHFNGFTCETIFEIALYGCFACRLAWLEFNLQRLLNSNISIKEIKIARRETKTAIEAISMLNANSAIYQDWFNNASNPK